MAILNMGLQNRRNIALFMVIFMSLFFLCQLTWADDTCMFTVSTDQVPPNIVFLLDNGAEMEQIKWHGDYDKNVDYTPQNATVEVVNNSETDPPVSGNEYKTLVLTNVDEGSYSFDKEITGLTSRATALIEVREPTEAAPAGGTLELKVVEISNGPFIVGETIQRYKNKNSIATGTLDQIIDPPVVTTPEAEEVSGFLNADGYSLVNHGGVWCLVKILPTLEPDSYANGLDADSGGTWTINGRTITLPVQPSSVGQADAATGLSIIDNATIFRYSQNYLNWLFFGSYTGDGSDLPDKSRFYYAKQALLSVGKMTANKAHFGIYNFTSTTEGASNVQPLGDVVATVVDGDPASNVLTSNYVNNINNMGTVTYSPLAEGLATIGGYYDSPSSGVESEYYCQNQYVIVVSSGISSEDQSGANQYLPTTLSDFDGDTTDSGTGSAGTVTVDSTVLEIPQNTGGSTWLDDVAFYLYTHDMVGYVDGFQNVMTYTVGVMTGLASNAYLTNTSNNGNGHKSLYDTTNSNYGDYHFTADSAEDLSSAILNAVNSILTGNSTFTAPVVPVTRTLSGNKIYLALFTPQEGNFWKGNVLKFGLDDNLNIIDKEGNVATESNGAIKASAKPYWATINWANADYSTQDCTGGGCNYIDNADRNIYTYIGFSNNLTNEFNEFSTDNLIFSWGFTASILGNPIDGVNTLVDYIRGADALDEDGDGNIDENRDVITGDVLHSEPVIFEYRYTDGTSESYVFFGANDGMLHAVKDQTTSAANVETNFGTEAWGFIPTHHLPRLKYLIEGGTHPFYVDSTPKIYFSDVDGDGIVDSGDQVVLISGERKGGDVYFALDITDPEVPKFMWQLNGSTLPGLGESWSEPAFGIVKTGVGDTVGTPVMFIGGGYSADNSLGKVIFAIRILNGTVVQKWYSGHNMAVDSDMTASIPSAVNAVDEDSNGFIDKLYVGDMAGRIWRVGNFVDTAGNPLVFPECDENINTWKAQVVFNANDADLKFYYAPRVTLEKGYDLVFAGTGDREDACNTASGPDMILAFKDYHVTADASGTPVPVTLTDLVNTTSSISVPPVLDDPAGDVDTNGSIDNGWYFNMETGEKILAEGAVFYKTVYITSFLPNNDPCLPGGGARLYALNYKTGKPAIDFDPEADGEDVELEPYEDIGGGIPSEPVVVISEKEPKLFITVGSPTPDDDTDTDGQPGVISMDPLAPTRNFFYLWWREGE
ncbi:type IV pilus assembly protein PilY1 [Desulfocicer vacuolatum DSM 3385]|uniref:Type IV pilus assembly protein PilY1 n=1 Tax=Desulfocicer vacuolatum DSM 3385 TaxID=1121400 RepID=A0A1W1ZGF3_9BACT|nr:PilC/PilY family type IV pilus protein [Desulfocicer vacuolatum]SMC47559.1 type IV pilus assembly protein PilY1 [Desulfocicer vacuolatum DSM 3385]